MFPIRRLRCSGRAREPTSLKSWWMRTMLSRQWRLLRLLPSPRLQHLNLQEQPPPVPRRAELRHRRSPESSQISQWPPHWRPFSFAILFIKKGTFPPLSGVCSCNRRELMFREALLESSPVLRKRRHWPMATAFTVELIVAAVLVIVPLISTGVIPLSATRLTLPVPPTFTP